jgi:hypothetical protein
LIYWDWLRWRMQTNKQMFTEHTHTHTHTTMCSHISIFKFDLFMCLFVCWIFVALCSGLETKWRIEKKIKRRCESFINEMVENSLCLCITHGL